MTNGEKFGDQRTKAWQRLVFSTCVQSFNDGVGLLAKRWHRDGDIFGANHLIGLGTTSDAPLCKWDPSPCPYIASGAGESLNQQMKNSPKDGTRRYKLTYVQLSRKVMEVGHNSYLKLRDGPGESQKKMQTLLEKHMAKKDAGCPGRHALIQAGLECFTYRAFQIFLKHVQQSERHTVQLKDREVWSDYQALTAPNKIYAHSLKEPKKNQWTCRVKVSNKPCWQHAIRGIFCPHMCAYAIRKIAAGGVFDLKAVGLSSLARHRAEQSISIAPTTEVVAPRDFSDLQAHTKTKKGGSEWLKTILPYLSKFYLRAGDEGLQSLTKLLQFRLLGGGPGDRAHELVDDVFRQRRKQDTLEVDTQPPRNAYENNTRDPGTPHTHVPGPAPGPPPP